MTSFHILTGATSGMGLHIASALARKPGAVVVAGVRSPQRASALRDCVPQDQLVLHPLDLDSLQSVSVFSETVLDQLPDDAQIESIICNAGLQLIGPMEMATATIERTFLVNFLSHFLLVELLLPRLRAGGAVVTVGSGTHNRDDRIAKLFGFRGATFPDVPKVAAGTLGTSGNDMQLGMDRYATSKLCAIYQALAMAEAVPSQQAVFYAFDPGLMPGTDLARARSMMERFGWHYVLPALRPFVRGISSGAASGRALVQHCIEGRQHRSGSYIEFTGDPAPRSEDVSRCLKGNSPDRPQPNAACALAVQAASLHNHTAAHGQSPYCSCLSI